LRSSCTTVRYAWASFDVHCHGGSASGPVNILDNLPCLRAAKAATSTFESSVPLTAFARKEAIVHGCETDQSAGQFSARVRLEIHHTASSSLPEKR